MVVSEMTDIRIRLNIITSPDYEPVEIASEIGAIVSLYFSINDTTAYVSKNE